MAKQHVALTAIAGGLALVLAPDGSIVQAPRALLAAPDGSIVQAPRALLAHTPFHSFALPGAILLAVGLMNAVAAIRVIRESASANRTSIFAGVALFGWIVGEMILLRSANILQIGYLAIAYAIVGEAMRRIAAHTLFART